MMSYLTFSNAHLVVISGDVGQLLPAPLRLRLLPVQLFSHLNQLLLVGFDLSKKKALIQVFHYFLKIQFVERVVFSLQ